MNNHTPHLSSDAKAAIARAVSTAARLLREARAVESFGPHYYDDAVDTEDAVSLLGQILGIDLTGQAEALRDWLEENPNRSEVRLVAWMLTTAQNPAPADFEMALKAQVERVADAVNQVVSDN